MENGANGQKGLDCTLSLNQLSVVFSLVSPWITMTCTYQRGTGKGRKMLAFVLVLVGLLVELLTGGISRALHTLKEIWPQLQILLQ